MLNLLIVMAACAGTGEASCSAAWLERMEAKAGEVVSLRADMRYTREQGLLGDKQHRYGTLVYEAGPPAKFRARFDRLAVDGALHAMEKDYIFDGRYLVERDADERIWTRWELAGEGESVDLLALGEGPFSLPLNMKKDRVLERFEVTVAEDGEDQPVHLVLVPRADQETDVTRVDLWFERETLLPVRARQEAGDDATEVTLTKVEVNPPPAEGGERFDTTPPGGAGWQVNEHPLPVEGAAEGERSPSGRG